MGTLTGNNISQTYQGLIKLADSTTGITSVTQSFQDGLGNNIPIQVSQTVVNISGSLLVNGVPITGSTGSSGTSGSSGSSGINGTSGTSGVSGTNGTSGSSGVSGTSGTSGSSGISGTSGTSGDSIFAQTGSVWNTTNNIGITGSLHQSGTFYPDVIDWISSSIQPGTGSYILTTNNVGVTQYDTYQNIALALDPYISESIFAQTGSFYATTNNIQITGSLNVTGSVSQKGGNILIQHQNETIDFNVTSSVGGNIIFGNGGRVVNQSGSLFISGSENIVFNSKAVDAVGFRKYINGDGNIGVVPVEISTTSSIANNVSNNLILSQGTVGARINQITSSLNPNTQNYAQNINLNQSQTFTHTQAGLNFINNIGMGNILSSFATTSFIPGNIGYTSNLMIGTNTFTYPSGSATIDRNVMVGLNAVQYNNFGSGSAQTVARNLIGGASNTINNNSGSIAVGNNVIWGSNNLISLGGNRSMSNTSVLGNLLIVSGSNTSATDGGAVFVGRFNATGSSQENSLENIFVVGSGTADGARRNALRIDNNGNSNFTGSINISGSLILNGSAVITGSVQGNVNTLSLSFNTASLDLNQGNFFTLQLVSGSVTHIQPSNIKPGQTINLLLNTTGSGTVTFPSSVKQVSGSSYVPTTTTGVDVVTLISFDSSSLYLANVKNLI